MVRVTSFRSPCDRCSKVRYLELRTSLCVSISKEPLTLAEMDSCFEWWRYYQTLSAMDVMDDWEEVA